MSNTLVITADNVLLPGSDDGVPATIVVDRQSGKITDVKKSRSHRSDFPEIADESWIDAGNKWILPGLVDAHVHLNEPGRTDWEGFWTGTRAAASGGVTTVVDMPLNSIPPTTTREHLATKRRAAQGQCWVDVAFWGGLVPGNEGELKAMVDDGVKGFKGFLIDSGVEEFPAITGEDVQKAMKELEGTSTVLLFHAELETDEHRVGTMAGADPTLYSTFLASRPPELETAAIELIIRLQRQHPQQRCHIVHLATAAALPAIRSAQAAGAPLTAETCAHYLMLATPDVPDAAPQFKCCPPVRGDADRDALWSALRDGTLGCVVSDHSPCTAPLKRLVGDGADGDLLRAWGGISTLGLALSLLWTEGRKRGVRLGELVRWMSAATAQHAGLNGRKGAIRAGWDADLVLWDPEAELKVDKESLHFKNKLSAYEGMTLVGRVEKTFVRGHLAWDSSNAGEGLGPVGQLI